MQSKETKALENTQLASHRRKVAEKINFIFPGELADSYHGLKEARALVADGHGLLIVLNHFSYRDGPGAFVYIAAQNDELASKPWLAPVARHIYEVTDFLNRHLQTQIDLKPVVTSSTVKKPKYADLKQGAGLIDYIKGSIRTLRDGGVVVLFPQATRRPFLGEPGPDDRAMELLMRLTTKPNPELNDFGILPVGFGLDHVKDYTKHNWINLLRTYKVNVGKLWVKDEMISSAHELHLSPDAWVVHQLRPLVPENYRFPPSGVVFKAP